MISCTHSSSNWSSRFPTRLRGYLACNDWPLYGGTTLATLRWRECHCSSGIITLRSARRRWDHYLQVWALARVCEVYLATGLRHTYGCFVLIFTARGCVHVSPSPGAFQLGPTQAAVDATLQVARSATLKWHEVQLFRWYHSVRTGTKSSWRRRGNEGFTKC